MSIDSVVNLITNPSVVAVVSAIIGYVFHNWKIAPKKKVQRALKAIEDYAPIVFECVEEMARVAKKNNPDNALINKIEEYEKEIKRIVLAYGGIWNNDIKTIAHVTAKAINNSTQK